MLLMADMGTKEIAASMNRSERSVYLEFKAMMRHLGAKGMFYLALRSYQEGLLPEGAGCRKEVQARWIRHPVRRSPD